MFDPKHPRGAYPGAAAMKPQYVLITENGEERTSNATPERIVNAVNAISTNGYVTIEKCRPAVVVQDASVFAISFYKDSRISVYFKIGGTVLRTSASGCTCREAAEMVCDFLLYARIPDTQDWTCEELMPVQFQRSESSLTVDGEEFRYFGSDDVMVALENIREGKSRWLTHGFTGEGENGGYVHVLRCDTDGGQPEYKVEWVRWTQPPTGCRTAVSCFDLVGKWLSDFSIDRKYPEQDSGWESFDVEDYFQNLINRFSKDNER
ncbi:MAG: hypothetical protein NC308_11930 [Clostridium sp.]|nr:hypothetical protein [Bacteroides sp.]MCM1199587.1 hypothetical protein [Clostridium sp.]